MTLNSSISYGRPFFSLSISSSKQLLRISTRGLTGLLVHRTKPVKPEACWLAESSVPREIFWKPILFSLRWPLRWLLQSLVRRQPLWAQQSGSGRALRFRSFMRLAFLLFGHWSGLPLSSACCSCSGHCWAREQKPAHSRRVHNIRRKTTPQKEMTWLTPSTSQ